MLGRMTQTLQDLGKILIYQGKYAEAIDTFERAEKMSWDIEGNSFNPFPVLFQHKIGLAQIGKGDLDSTRRSIEIIKQYIQEQRLEAFYLNFAYLLEAAIHGAQKNWPATSEALKKCSPSFGRVPFYINSSAEACVLNNELAQAVELYQSFKTNISMSRYGNDAIFFFRYSSLADYNLGKVYELMGSEANATEHYEKFLDLWNDADPGIAEVEDARERLARLTLE
jgi:tetratricopeptide (TPR) repeat protein